jgi:oxaloacetate decarboxylase alpha subunit
MTAKPITIVDETLRDAHQCLWMTRMTNEMMLPFAERLDRIGFAAIDLIGGAVWDVAVRFLREDPWERIRHVRALMDRTPINAWIRGQSLWTFEIFPDDIVELAIERLAANGIRWMTLYDQFNDLQNVAVCVKKGKAEGLNVLGALVFSESPVHTDEYFALKAAEFVALGADEIIIKDPSGMLSVERTRTLVPAVRAAINAIPINMHTHCMSGRAPDVLIEAAHLGVERLHTAISPLAHGASHPPTEDTDSRLRDAGYDPGLDGDLLAEMADYFTYVARRWEKPVGRPHRFDPRLAENQMPGGMITNLRNQLGELDIEHRLDEVLAEMGRVRKDMGYVPVVSPTAQFMATQAVLNVIQGERYKTVPDELKKYVLGYYGTPPAPIADELKDRAVGPGDKFVDGPAGSLVPPAIPRLKKERGPFRSDEDLLQAAFYGEDITRPLFDARDKSDFTKYYAPYTPLEFLEAELAKRRNVQVSGLSLGGE